MQLSRFKVVCTHHHNAPVPKFLPSGYANQTPASITAFDSNNTPEDSDVEGNTFQAYSIPSSRNNLGKVDKLENMGNEGNAIFTL